MTTTPNLALSKPAAGASSWDVDINGNSDTLDALFHATTGNHDHAGTTGHGKKLAQSATHESPDTDASTSALHHTLGTGANQAAAGTHNHTGTYQPLDSDLTTIAGLTATTDTFLQAKASAWASRTPTQVTADLIGMVGDSGSGGTKGLVPAPASGDAAAGKFLKADGTFAVPAGSGDPASATHAATSKATPVDADELPLVDSAASNVLKKLTWANLKATAKAYFDTLYQVLDADLTTIAGLTATTDNFLQAKSSAWASRTPTQVTADLIAVVGDSGSGGTKGLVPAPGAGDAAAGKFLKADGTFAVPSGGGGGSGDVVGPSSAVASEIALFDGTTGKLIKRATGSGIAKVTSGVLSAVTAPSGAIVGDTDTQTLTNKTLTTPTIGSFANATHTHQNAAGGGTLDAAAVASGVLAIGRLATGTPDGTRFVRDDGTLAVPAGTGMTNPMTAKGDLIVGAATATTNQALAGAGASFSASVTLGGSAAANGFDANDSTYWSPQASGITGTPSLHADLGSAKTITTYRVASLNTNNGASAYKIQSSPDDSTWTDQATIASAAPVDSGEVALATATSARYWRLLVTGVNNGAFQLAIVTVEFRSGNPAGTAARLGVGTDDQLLVADSAQTNGAKWAARALHQTLTDGATVSWNVRLGNAQVTLGGNRTLAAPTNLVAGMTYTLIVIQDGTGSRTLTWNAVFKWAGGTAPTLSTVAARKDVFVFYTDGTNLYCTSQQINVA